MIYVIRAVGTQFVKIGKSNQPWKRLKELETGCPHELHLEAIAEWPDAQESAIHLFLFDHCEKYEWFRDSEDTAKVISWLQDREHGLRAFRVAFIQLTKNKAYRLSKSLSAEYETPSQAKNKRNPLMPLDTSRALDALSPGDRKILKRQQERMDWWKSRGLSATTRCSIKENTENGSHPLA